jgi:hypothetical protein
MSSVPLNLLVNPWITDFSAYDLWAKPLGLLRLAGLLREGGCGVHFIDCTDRHDARSNAMPGVKPGRDRPFGTGKLPRMEVPKPDAYAGVRLRYHRHGIHPDRFRERLRDIPRPDLVWVTSHMTYWYLGVRETVACIREAFPDVPVWLGGIYAKLCPGHARSHSGAHCVVTEDESELPARIEAETGFAVRNRAAWGGFDDGPLPALDLTGRVTDYAPVLTSLGCPLACPYCASKRLQPRFRRRSTEAVFREIVHWHERYGTVDFAFYDDALLMGADATLRPALERLRREGLRLRFHTPNAVHVEALDEAWCALLFESGFRTLRLGFETARAARQAEWGGKTNTKHFEVAVRRLTEAGFARGSIGAYLLCGVPGQTVAEVEEGIRVVSECGADPYLAEYSPIPGTALWRDAVRISAFDLESEPLYHNNTFFACRRPDFTPGDMQRLKLLAKAVRTPRAPAIL